MGKKKIQPLETKQPKFVNPAEENSDKSESAVTEGVKDIFSNLEAQVGSKFVWVSLVLRRF